MSTQSPGGVLENYFPLAIKTKRFLRPYLEALYGNPVCFSFNSTLGTILAGLLERPYKTHKRKDLIQFRVFDKFDKDLIIYLPKSWLKEYKVGHSLSDHSIVAFNKFFENMFEEDLYKFCELARSYKTETKLAIEDFCMRHHISIEEDITYDCLKQKEFRFRKEQQKVKNIPPHLSRQIFAMRKIV